MEKTCQKANCVNTYISRGKYCDKHRTKKKKIPSTISEEFESLKVIEDKKKEVESHKRSEGLFEKSVTSHRVYNTPDSKPFLINIDRAASHVFP